MSYLDHDTEGTYIVFYYNQLIVTILHICFYDYVSLQYYEYTKAGCSQSSYHELIGYMTLLKTKKSQLLSFSEILLEFCSILVKVYKHDLTRAFYWISFNIGRDMSRNVWDRLLGSSMVGTGILSNNMRSPSPECYTTFWMMTVYSDTLHWSGITLIFDPIIDLDLITEFDFLPNCERFP